MKKPVIKFSYRYEKMPDEVEIIISWLVGVSVCDIETLPDDFIDYDTDYGKGNYPLARKGKFMVLTIFTNGYVWTTIRRYIPYKEKYYRSLIGQEIEIEVV